MMTLLYVRLTIDVVLHVEKLSFSEAQKTHNLTQCNIWLVLLPMLCIECSCCALVNSYLNTWHYNNVRYTSCACVLWQIFWLQCFNCSVIATVHEIESVSESTPSYIPCPVLIDLYIWHFITFIAFWQSIHTHRNDKEVKENWNCLLTVGSTIRLYTCTQSGWG